MNVLTGFGLAAGILLLLYLLIFLFLFAGIAGGLAFGLHWGRGKTGWGFGKVNALLPRVAQYADLGTGYAAKPFILAGAWIARGEATLEALQRVVRASQAATAAAATRPETAAPAAVPVPEPEDTVPEPVRLT